MKGKRILALALALMMALCLIGCGSKEAKKDEAQKTDGATDKVCYLTVTDCCDKQEFSYEKGDTAYDLLKKSDLKVETEGNIGDGVFITKIGKLEGDSSHAWVYTVNEEEVMDAADQHEIEAGDSVEFEYIEF